MSYLWPHFRLYQLYRKNRYVGIIVVVVVEENLLEVFSSTQLYLMINKFMINNLPIYT